jgi:hypothetical protein
MGRALCRFAGCFFAFVCFILLLFAMNKLYPCSSDLQPHALAPALPGEDAYAMQSCLSLVVKGELPY